ncbi:MAG TPA: dihydroorotase [Bacillota bacterium]|nr:dihydroorotase [Bacillota bacterium]
MKYCIKNGKIIDPAGGYVGVGDILIDNGKIAAIDGEISADDAEIISAEGKMVFPGLIDLHTHLREPGREDEETIATGTKAALKGGFTAVACMANTQPVADNGVVISFILEKARKEAYTKVYPLGAITKGLKGEELAEMGDMVASGAYGFSDDGNTLMNASVLRLAIEYASMFDRPLMLHQEDVNLAGNGVMHEGYWSTVLGLPGIPDIAEAAIIARDLTIAEFTGFPVHCCHVSTKKGVELIRVAKARGVRVTAEATPHHLTLTDAMIETFDTVYRVSPPLRSEEDVEALRQGVQDGTIDVIATDHAPHSLEEKHREFSLAPNGMIGLETALAVIWTEMVCTGILTPEQLVERMSVNPARILKVAGGRLRPGDPADVVIFNPDKQWTVRSEELVSKSKNSPFIGKKLNGRVESVWVDGMLKYCNENFT